MAPTGMAAAAGYVSTQKTHTTTKSGEAEDGDDSFYDAVRAAEFPSWNLTPVAALANSRRTV